MNITETLIELDGSLSLHDEGEWGNTVSLYSAFNDAGLECEVGEFFYSLVRILKPERVLETGSHVGVGASYIGLGLRDNNRGKLDTIEFLPELYKQAFERINRIGVDQYVKLHLQDARYFTPETSYDLILLDTEPQTRFGEFVKFYPYLKEGGFVFIHDLHRHMHQIPNVEHGFAWPFGLIPDFMVNLVHDGKVRPFHFSTPRGLTGFYKVSSQDYKFTK